MNYRTLHTDRVHYGWDRAIEPAIRAEPGESIRFQIIDASGGQITAESDVSVFEGYDSGRVNPVTGPVYVEGAEPGDALRVTIESFEPSGWGWTALIPGFGLLADQFPDPLLHISRYDSDFIDFVDGVRVPVRPFPGTLGVAPAAAGRHSVIPPRRVGGNMDVRDIVRGAVVTLPIEVPGALFSIGDTHAAQGDGEVCGTAVESPIGVSLRLDLIKDAAPPTPTILAPPTARPAPTGPAFITTGIADDLMTAARDATRHMIDHIAGEYGLSPELAYCLCSIAADLRISELVDAPNWVVTMHLPTGVFT